MWTMFTYPSAAKYAVQLMTCGRDIHPVETTYLDVIGVEYLQVNVEVRFRVNRRIKNGLNALERKMVPRYAYQQFRTKH